MAWTLLGEVTIGPNDNTVSVGTVTLGAGDDTLWVRATQLTGPEPWEFSYGLLYLVTPEGRELGTIKVWPCGDGEVRRMTVGLAPEGLTGELLFDSRWVNRRWLGAMNTTLRMRFEVQSGVSGGGIQPPASYAGSFVTSAGTGLTLARVVFP
jgi:hypothetical protein